MMLPMMVANRAQNSAPSTFTITASAESNVSISPSGDVSVNSGASQTFTITASAGYDSYISVDGGAATKATSYQFTNVTAAHTIAATAQVIASVRTAMGVTNESSGTVTSTVTNATGSLNAGDLVTIFYRYKATTPMLAEDVTVDGNPAYTQASVEHNAGWYERVCTYLATGGETGNITVTLTDDGDLPTAFQVVAARYSNIGSATAHKTSSGSGTSGTTYSTTAQTTTVKTVNIGTVGKNSGSCGSDNTWTAGQALTNSYLELFALNVAAGSTPTRVNSTGGGSAAWGAIFAAFPVRTS